MLSRILAVTLILILLTVNIFLATGDAFLPVDMQDEAPKSPLDQTKMVEGPISYVMDSNLSVNSDGYHVKIPSYHVETNSKGLREESFSAQKPEGVKRILFLGDSFTFGWGVNSSDRFSDIVEKKLNNGSSKRHQSINAGIPGYGMEDNLILFRERGINYNPDIVIVSFSSQDVLSTRNSKSIREQAENLTPSDKESKIREKELELQRTYMRETSVRESNLSEHMLSIDRLAKKNNMKAIFFEINRISRVEKQFYRNLERSRNITIVYPPNNFSKKSSDEFRISDEDPHYNDVGHKWLANKLYRNLNQNLKE